MNMPTKIFRSILTLPVAIIVFGGLIAGAYTLKHVQANVSVSIQKAEASCQTVSIDCATDDLSACNQASIDCNAGTCAINCGGTGGTGGNTCPNGADGTPQCPCPSSTPYWDAAQGACYAPAACWDGSQPTGNPPTICPTTYWCVDQNTGQTLGPFANPNQYPNSCSAPACGPITKYTDCGNASGIINTSTSPVTPYSYEVTDIYWLTLQPGPNGNGIYTCQYQSTDITAGEQHVAFCDANPGDASCCPSNNNNGGPGGVFNYNLSTVGTAQATQGGSTVYTNPVTENLSLLGGSPEKVALTFSGLPAGVTVDPAFVNDTCFPSTTSIGQGCASSVRFAVAPSTVSGNYTVQVTGTPETSGSPVKTSTIILNIGNVSSCYSDTSNPNYPCPPALIDVGWGLNGILPNFTPQYTILPGPIYGNIQGQRNYVEPADAGTTYILTPAVIPNYTYSVVNANINQPGNSVTLRPGDYARFVVTYTTAPSFDYSLSNNGPQTVTESGSNVFAQETITKTLTSGTSQSVTLAVTGLPSGVIPAFDNNSACNPSCQTVLSLTIPPSTSPGTYSVTVTGTPLSHTTNFSLTINSAPNVTSTCSVTSSLPAKVGVPVTWSVGNISGGTPPYTYAWSGTNLPNPGPTTSSFNVTYNTVGQKTATAVVTDNNGIQGTCNAGGGATVQVTVNPTIIEF